MMPRELADWLENLGEFPPLFPDKVITAIRAQADEIDRLKAEATALANQSFITIKSWKDLVDGLAAEIAALKASAIVAGSIKLSEWSRLETELCARAQQVKNLMAENSRLKDVVRHAEYWESVRKEERDAAVKVAQRREAVKAAWERITGGLGWLSCFNDHDHRCAANGIHYTERGCLCGADDFRKLMDE